MSYDAASRTIGGESSLSLRLKDMERRGEPARSSESSYVPPYPSSSAEPLDSSRLDASVDSSSLLGPEESYQRELQKLLVKSRGTPYEAAMLKFFQSKMGGAESITNYSLADSLLPSQRDESARSDKRSRSSMSPVSRQRQRVENMSQPLPRHAPPPPAKVTAFTPTNGLGRQRPPPSTEAESVVTRKVSLREFNAWLKRNERWKRDCDKAIEEVQERENMDSRLISSPRLHSRTGELVDRARSRESSRSRIIMDTSLEQPRPSSARPTRARFSMDSKAQGQAQPQSQLRDSHNEETDLRPSESISKQNSSMLSIEESLKSSYVFDRLAARSREYAFQMRNKANEPQQYSFSPELTSRSREIVAKKRRSWSRDPATRLLVSPSRPEQPQKLPTSPSQLSSVSTSVSVLKDAKKRKSVSPDRSLGSTRSNERITRSISSGRQRRASVVASWETSSDFQPKLSAPKTNKIVKSKNVGYQERLNRSVEVFHLQKQLSEIIGTPGPGSYGGSVVERPKSSKAKKQSA